MIQLPLLVVMMHSKTQRLDRTRALPGSSGVATLAVALIVSCGAAAQTAVAPAIKIVPRISATETYTDNATLASTGKRTEWITQVSPGISIVMRGSRVRGSIDYSLNLIGYANGSRGDQTQNALRANGAVEIVDDLFFLDFSGSVSQQATSAFGQQSLNGTLVNANSSEVSSYQLVPYVRGVWGGRVNYQLRQSWTLSSSEALSASDSLQSVSSLNLSGAINGPLGWTAGWTRQQSDYKGGGDTKLRRVQGGLTYSFVPQVSITATVAHESNNFAAGPGQSSSNLGIGANWTLSERTRMAADFQRRSFGHSHGLNFSHRTGRTAWLFSDSQDVSTTPANAGLTVVGSLRQLLDEQFQGVEADPARRADLVSQFLTTNGLSGDAPVLSSFLSSSVSLQRRQQLSFTLLGVRDTFSVILLRTANTRLSALAVGVDDFSTSSVVRQNGLTASWSHRLTPDSSLSASASWQRSSGDALAVSTQLRALDLRWSGRVGRSTTASFGARRTAFDSPTAPYTETSISGSVNVQF